MDDKMINKNTTAPIYSTLGIAQKKQLEEIAKTEGYKLSQFIKKYY